MDGTHRKVMVADRDASTVELVSTWLEPLGYEVMTGGTIATAIGGLRGHKQAIVLVATTLPDFDEGQLCRTLRSELEHVQIIILLPEYRRNAVLAAFEAGADDVIAKPFLVAEFRTRLRSAARTLMLESMRGDRETEHEIIAEIGASANVHSRRYLDVQLNHEILRAYRFEHELALVLVDAPSIGGDKRAARTLGRLLADQTRRHIDWVADCTEHTFALVLPETPLHGALKMAERLHDTLTGPAPVAAGLPGQLRVSFGISTLGGTSESAPALDAQALIRSAQAYLSDVARQPPPRIGGGASKALPPKNDPARQAGSNAEPPRV